MELPLSLALQWLERVHCNPVCPLMCVSHVAKRVAQLLEIVSIFFLNFLYMVYLSAEVSAAAGVQGLMSLIFWTITLVVVFK